MKPGLPAVSVLTQLASRNPLPVCTSYASPVGLASSPMPVSCSRMSHLCAQFVLTLWSDQNVVRMMVVVVVMMLIMVMPLLLAR